MLPGERDVLYPGLLTCYCNCGFGPGDLYPVKEEGLTRALKNYMVSDPQYIDTEPTGERHLT